MSEIILNVLCGAVLIINVYGYVLVAREVAKWFGLKDWQA